MSIQVVSGATTDVLTVDATSKAARTTLYGPDGQALLYNSNTDRGILQIQVRQTTTTAAGAAVWALRNNTNGKTLYIRKIMFQFVFDGTGAASLMRYEWIKGTGCTAMSGGAAVTALLKRTSITNGDVDCRVLDTGITQTGITQGTAFYQAAWPRITFSATQAGGISGQYIIDFESGHAQPLELLQNEVLSLRNALTPAGGANAAVVGDTVLGGVEFYGG